MMTDEFEQRTTEPQTIMRLSGLPSISSLPHDYPEIIESCSDTKTLHMKEYICGRNVECYI